MNEEEKLTEIFGEKEVTEDSIMSEARRIFKYQESVGNPYSMHVAFEFATKELGELKQSQEASPLETIVMWLKCLLFGHDWLYTSERQINESWSRVCCKCDKMQHQEYDNDGFPIGWQST